MTRFSSILVANRGEIACRIMRTASALGYRTIAVYSDADVGAPHVKMADEALCIGAGPVNESYLLMDNILQAAKTSGAEAVHPGYGFLSENANFAKRCEEAGLIFIGPGAEAIHLMGNKAEAKRRMLDTGVPCVPGYEGQDQSDATLITEAQNLEFPLTAVAVACAWYTTVLNCPMPSNSPGQSPSRHLAPANLFWSRPLFGRVM